MSTHILDRPYPWRSACPKCRKKQLGFFTGTEKYGVECRNCGYKVYRRYGYKTRKGKK